MVLAAQIKSVSHFVPERVVSNNDFTQWMDTSDEWITERTGIKERRFVEEGVPTSALAAHACLQALEKASMKAHEIDLIIAATLSPDFYFPGIACQLQEKLGLGHVGALDIRAQCSGFVYGLNVADAFIRSGMARNILLVCAEVQSPVLELSNRGRDMAVLFGDGAGAFVISAAEEAELPTTQNSIRGVIDSELGSDGSGAEVLCLKVPGTANPGFFRETDFAEGTWHPKMDGRTVFKNAVGRMMEVAECVMRRNNLKPQDISMLVPHQANLRINEAVREKLSLSEEQVFNTIERYGNTTAATIPICLSEAVAAGRLKAGDLVLTLAFGAGFTWGANLVRW
ncbi:MAG: ketoacyl-ACP synthase III [Bdellovibrionales bacterium]|nr:ketoacyl-ACP synthase III [Bdellovibrionales bacterium]